MTEDIQHLLGIVITIKPFHYIQYFLSAYHTESNPKFWVGKKEGRSDGANLIRDILKLLDFYLE